MLDNYLKSTVQQFKYYKLLGDKTIAQMSDDELTYQPNNDSNSIAILVKHMWGNMLSRWTEFLSSDGEKEWRSRDAEFSADITSRTELLDKWEEGWKCLFDALNTVNDSTIDTTIYIRNQGHTVVEAINRQMMHYSYHVGQMVFLGKTIKGNSWKNLSIPKGESKSYNATKFSQNKSKSHFTDEYLKS